MIYFFILFAAAMMFFFIPGSYLPFIHGKEMFFFCAVLPFCVVNIRRGYYRFLSRSEIILFLILIMHVFLSVFYFMGREYFNLFRFLLPVYYISGIWVITIFLKNISEREKNLLSVWLFIIFTVQKAIAIFQIVSGITFFEVTGRSSITGTLGSVNLLSFILGLSIVHSFRLFRKSRNYFLVADIIISLLVIAFLGTRSVILSLLICSAVVVRVRKYRVVAAAGVLILILFSVFWGMRDTFVNESVFQRLYIWKTAFAMIADNPLTGVGSGQFSEAFYYYAGDAFGVEYSWFLPENVYAMQAHNDILQLIAEHGIFSILYFAFFISVTGCLTLQPFLVIMVLVFALLDFPFHIVSTSFFITVMFFLQKEESGDGEDSLPLLRRTVFLILTVLILKGASAVIPANISDIYLVKALREKDVHKRMAELEKAMSYHDNARVYYEAGKLSLIRDEPEKAVKYLELASGYSGEPAISVTVARLFERSGKLNEALGFYLDAYRKSPVSVTYLENVIRLYQKLDEKEKAMYYGNIKKDIEYYRKNGGSNGIMGFFLKKEEKRGN